MNFCKTDPAGSRESKKFFAQPYIRKFFRFFNAFRMIKFMHYMSDHHFPDIPVLQAVVKLRAVMKWSISMNDADEFGYLKLLRSLDRENG